MSSSQQIDLPEDPDTSVDLFLTVFVRQAPFNPDVVHNIRLEHFPVVHFLLPLLVMVHEQLNPSPRVWVGIPADF